MSETCAAVSVAEPVNGELAVLPLVDSQTITPAFLPSGAGPWMCAAVAGPLQPENGTFPGNLSPSKVPVAEPVPVVVFGGTSLEAFMSALKVVAAARAREVKANS